jgi:ribosomal protein S27AE
MPEVGVILAGLLGIGAVIFVAWPLFRPPERPAQPEDLPEADRLRELVERREVALNALRDLEEDFRLGRIDEKEYKTLQARYRRRAVAALKAVDQALGVDTGALERLIEREVALARRRCPDCGRPLAEDFRFCPHCGQPLDVSPLTGR